MADTLSGVVSTTTSITRTVTDTVGTSERGVTVGANYTIDSVSGPLADQVWVSNRSVTGGQSETLDLLALTDTIQLSMKDHSATPYGFASRYIANRP